MASKARRGPRFLLVASAVTLSVLLAAWDTDLAIVLLALAGVGFVLHAVAAWLVRAGLLVHTLVVAGGVLTVVWLFVPETFRPASPISTYMPGPARRLQQRLWAVIQVPASPVTTTTTLIVMPTQVLEREPVRLTASVRVPRGGAQGLAGTVRFQTQRQVLGDAPITFERDRTYSTLVVTDLAAGQHEVTATYVGSRAFSRSVSGPVWLHVLPRDGRILPLPVP